MALPKPTLQARPSAGLSFLTDEPLFVATGVRLGFSRRQGGVSEPPYDGLNLGDHVEDDPMAVAENRALLLDAAGLGSTRLLTLNQVHGDVVLALDDDAAAAWEEVTRAGAAGADGVAVDGTLGESLNPARTYVAAEGMNREPGCAADTATMAEVIRLMDANQTSGLPVVNAAGDLVGFVSDGDVASYLGKTEIALVDSTLLNGYRYIDDEDAATRLRELMGLNVMAVATRRVISVEATTPVDEVCALFASKRIKKVPVVQDGKLVGALSRRNIMRSLVEAIDILEK